jgi:hypothetical protein
MAINQVLPRGIDLSKFIGQWVIICENKVVASNKDLTKLQKDIDRCERTPTIAKIPENDTLIF